MDIFGELKLQRNVYTTVGLTDIVRCTETLPDPNGAYTFVGTVYHLTDSQPGYTANHVYICAVKDGTRYWRDLTESSAVDADTSGLVTSGQIVEFNTEMYLLILAWETPHDTETKVWSRDVVMRKLGAYPASIEDGELITVCNVRNLYRDPVTAYKSGPVSPDPADQSYKYRVFHVFEDNSMTYNDINVLT